MAVEISDIATSLSSARTQSEASLRIAKTATSIEKQQGEAAVEALQQAQQLQQELAASAKARGGVDVAA